MMRPLLFSFFVMIITIPVSGQWVEMSEYITPTYFTRSVAWEDKVYFAGGFSGIANPNKKVEIFDLQTGQIEYDTLSVARGGMMCAAHAGKIYFAGGFRFFNGANIQVFSVVDVYDVVDKYWTTKNLSVARAIGSAVVVGGKIMFAGGHTVVNGQLTPTDVVDVYDPLTDSWEIMHLSQPKAFFQAAVVGDKAYFPGGSLNETAGLATKHIDIYDAAANAWSLDSLSVARGGLSCVAVGKYLIVAGGSSADIGESDVVDILDTEEGDWDTATLAEPRAYMGAAVVGQKAYFCGGGGITLPSLVLYRSSATVDVFAIGKSWETQQLNENRVEFACSAWGNKIVVGGGWRPEQNQFTGMVEMLTDTALVSVNRPVASAVAFSIAPNPVTETLYIQIGSEEYIHTSGLVVRIFDGSGRLVLLENASATGDGRFAIPVTSLPEGAYVLEIEASGAGKSVRSFLVRR